MREDFPYERGLVGQNPRVERTEKEEQEMSDEIRPDEEVEAHGPVFDGPGAEGPGAEGPGAEATDDPDVEAHAFRMGPGAEGPGAEGPGAEGPTGE